jgi:hypothetical protein
MCQEGQHKYKNYSCHSCKTWFKGQSKARSKSWIERVNIRLKNYYYYSFKTRLGSQSEATFRLWTGRVNLFNLKKILKIIKATLIFWSIFFFKCQQVFDPDFILSWLGYFTESGWVFSFFLFFLKLRSSQF